MTLLPLVFAAVALAPSAPPQSNWSEAIFDGDGALLLEPIARGSSRRQVEFRFSLREGEQSRIALSYTDALGDGVRLDVSFDPRAGLSARFDVREGDYSESRALPEFREPEGLAFHWIVELPTETGIVLRDGAGQPLVISRRPAVRTGALRLRRMGGVENVEYTIAPSVASVLPDSALDLAAQVAPPPEERSFAAALLRIAATRDAAPTAPAPLPEIQPALDDNAPLGAGRAVEAFEYGGLSFEKSVYEIADRVEVPLVVLRASAARGLLPGVLLEVEPGPQGKGGDLPIAIAIEAARAGCAVMLSDPLAGGERLRAQPRDSAASPLPALAGTSALAWRAFDLAQRLTILESQDFVDAKRLAVVAIGSAEEVATRLAQRSTRVALKIVIGETEASSPSWPTARSVASSVAQAFATTPLAGVAESEQFDLLELSHRTTLGEFEIGSTWDSWLQRIAYETFESLPPPDRTVALPERVARALQPWRSPKPLRAAVLGRAGSVSLLRWCNAEGVCFDAWTYGDVTCGEDGALPPNVRRVGIACADFGKTEALVEAVQRTEAGVDLWIAFDALGLKAGDPPVHEWSRSLEASGTTGLALWVTQWCDLIATLAQSEREFLLCGSGAQGLIAMLVAVQSAEHGRSIAGVRAVHAIPDFSQLLTIDPQHLHPGPESELLTEHPLRALYAPGLLRDFEVEDLALELADRKISLAFDEPVTALARPLLLYEQRSMWPRMQHRRLAPER